jgi:hypothetical protein
MYTGMTRTVKELLRVMLKHQDLFDTGLCDWVYRLYSTHLITSKECNNLLRYIDNNEPLKIKFFPLWYDRYYWKKGDIKPRIKWINKHRDKL